MPHDQPRPPGIGAFEVSGRLPWSACRRRRRALAPLSRDILRGRSGARSLTFAAWLALAGLVALIVQAETFGWLVLPGLALFGALCLVALFDARYFVIPDGPLLLLVLLGLAVSLVVDPGGTAPRIAAAASGVAALRAIAFGYEALRGAPGVGAGDARLFGVAGLWLGFDGLPGCLVYATFSALLSAVLALRDGTLEDARDPLPFGPHLALGFWLAFVFGPLEFG